MRNQVTKVFAKVQRTADGSIAVLATHARGKSAQTRWINSLRRNNDGAFVVLDSWTLDDGRGLDAAGNRVPS